MNSKPKPGRRIVSKGEYAIVQAGRTGRGIWGAYIVLLSALSGLVALICLALMLHCLVSAVLSHEWPPLASIALPAALIFVFGGVTAWLSHAGFMHIEKAMKSNVAPLTRANTANLPVADSLVRASQEPAQVQEGILLRAVAEGQEKHEEQLLRATRGGNE